MVIMKVFFMAVCLLILRLVMSHPHVPEGLPFPEEDIYEIICQLQEDIPSGSGSQRLHCWIQVNNIRGELASGKGYSCITIASDRSLFRGQTVRLAKTENGFYFLDDCGYSSFLWKFRADIVMAFKNRIEGLDRTNQAFMQTLLLGIKAPDSGRITQLFREAGCAHLLALSGFHLAYLAMLIGFLLQGLFGKRVVVFIARQILLLGYSCLAGAGPSLVRAFLMRFIRDLGTQWGIRLTPGLIFITAFFVQSFLFPDSLNSLSFQLSYAAIAGILFFLPLLDFLLTRFIPRKIVLPLAVSVAAVQFSLPFMLFHFGCWYWCGLLFSLLLSPLILLYLTLGLFYLIFPFGLSAEALRFVYSIIYQLAGYSVFFEPIRFSNYLCAPVSLLLFLFNLSILAVIKVNQIVRIRKRSFQFKL